MAQKPRPAKKGSEPVNVSVEGHLFNYNKPLEVGFLKNFFPESCNFHTKVATLFFLGFLDKVISSVGFNFVTACLNGFFKHFLTP